MANAYFKFRVVDDFDYNKNRKDCFDLADMNGVDLNYKVVLAKSCPVDINQCLDEDGTLNDRVEILNTFGESDGLVALLYSRGVNRESTISMPASSITYELSDDIDYVQGMFLVSYSNGSGYVLAYSVNNVPVEIQDDQLILNLTGMVWGTHHAGD